MKRYLLAGFVTGLAALCASAGGAAAQANLELGGGATLPLGGYSDYAEPGWIAHGGVTLPVGAAGLAVGASGSFGINAHEPPPEGDETRLYGGLGSVRYAFDGPAAATPFIFGAAGLMIQDYESETQPGFEGSDTGVAAGGGVGLTFPLRGVAAFAEAWLLNVFFDRGNTTVAGLTAGVRLEVGGGA